jgi:hypothetical protein
MWNLPTVRVMVISHITEITIEAQEWSSENHQ